MEETKVSDEILLHAICAYKPLFDKKCKGYKSILQKENCWQAVAQHLGITVTVAKTRFKSLREKYRREIALEEKLSRSGASSNNRPQWSLLSIFKYMMDDADCRSTDTNMEEDDGNVEVESQVIGTKSPSPLIFHVDDERYTLEIVDSSCLMTTAEQNVNGKLSKSSKEKQLGSPPSNEVLTSPTPESSGESVTPASKRKKHLRIPTADNDKEINEILQNVSSAVSDIAKRASYKEGLKNNKFEKFAAYLTSELEEFSQENANIFIDSVTENLIEFKRKLRDDELV